MAFLDKMWRNNAGSGKESWRILFVMMFQHQKGTSVIYVLDMAVQVAYLSWYLQSNQMEPSNGIVVNQPYEYISQRAISGGLHIYLYMDFDSFKLKAYVAASSNANCSFTLKTTNNLQSNTFGYVEVAGCSSGNNCGTWSFTGSTQFTFTAVPNTNNVYWISTPDCGANQVLGFASDPAATEGSMVDVCLVAKATSGDAFERQTWASNTYALTESKKGETGPKVEEKPAA